ncbi:MAG: ABC transporter permease, partial [Geminicoccales bacterium]
MSRYLIRRVLWAIVVMWAVATLVFFMLRAVPGDPIAAMLFDVGDPAAIEALRQKYGLDQPVWVQYVRWFGLVLQGDLGTSLLGSQIEVARIIREAFPRTISLATLSFLLALVIAVPAGLISALKRHSAIDHAVTMVAFLGLSMPDFWLAILL